MESGRNNRVTGRKGEDAACLYLTGNGHAILERNWRYGHLEIDIISMDRNGIHFVEVKSRTEPVPAAPQENVGRLKQERICRAANRYISMERDSRLGMMECHFDVISVVFGKDRYTVEMFPDAYFPGLY